MNARQMKKRLKKQIAKLQTDNSVMRRIIANNPTMQEVYDVYNYPLKVAFTKIPFREYKVKKIIPVDMAGIEGIIENTKQAVTEDLFECIKENIIYKIETECMTPTITASIFVGGKESEVEG